MEFRWNEWNLEHASRHGVGVDEAQRIVEAAGRPYPENIGDGKFIVIGDGAGGRLVQVIYVVGDDGALYVIHARPLNDREKRRYRRRAR